MAPVVHKASSKGGRLSATAAIQPTGTGDDMRILHTMLRVADLERSTRFYTEVLGMRVLRQRDVPEYKYTLAFVGYGDEAQGAVLELTYNYGVDKYDLGTAFG